MYTLPSLGHFALGPFSPYPLAEAGQHNYAYSSDVMQARLTSPLLTSLVPQGEVQSDTTSSQQSRADTSPTGPEAPACLLARLALPLLTSLVLQDQVQSAESLSKGSRADPSPEGARDSSKASQQAAVASQDTQQQKGAAALSSEQQRAEAAKQRQESEAARQRRAALIDSITKQSPKGGQSQQARQLNLSVMKS